MTLDREIATAYAAAQARSQQAQTRQEGAPLRRDALRQGLLAWLKQRDAACAVPASRIEACLSAQMTARLAALAPQAVAAPADGGLADGGLADGGLVAPAAPPGPSPTPPVPSAANPPAPAATVELDSLPATTEADTLLHVTSPGRFTIAAHSASGAAVQLVDMLAGPTDIAGEAGSADGRLDELLDAGTYRLRVFSAPGARGAVGLTVTPFHDAAPPGALPAVGYPLDATLQDGEQRAFWLVVPSGAVRIEAAGRSLADLRLWRDGRDLMALAPLASSVVPVPGRPLADLLLAGKVEPGTYLVVAYGGTPLPWTDNAADQPFHLRAGAPDALVTGWTSGKIGPFGSAVFTLPAAARLLRLDLPAADDATLTAGGASAAITRRSREPVTTLGVDGKAQIVVLTAAAGQPYTLRAFAQPDETGFAKPGDWWVSGVTTGTGGDEVPPAVVLQRSEGDDKPPRIVADTLPRVAANAGWRSRFNLRGPTTLLFHATAGGPVSVRVNGAASSGQPVAAPDLPADYYALTLAPKAGVFGAVDVTLGASGQAPAAVAPLPVNPVIPLGIQHLDEGQSLALSGNAGPGVTVGLAARAVPVALAEGPLSATVTAGAPLAVPVAIAPGGSLAVEEAGVGPIGYRVENATAGRATVVVPPADHARTVVLLWRADRPAPVAIPAPPPPGQTLALTAGTPTTLDLARGEGRGLTLMVGEGGLYRIETTGRLHTTGRLATPFIPGLGEADGNGIGQNMLIQTMLRAGRYRVDVAAKDSAGHLGVLAAPAPLLAGATLRPGGSVRAALPAGTGVSFPITIGRLARYRIEAMGTGAPWTGRIEDAGGWPITRPGTLQDVEQDLQAGTYRLLVEPDAVARDVVARLTALPQPVAIAGHGPHALPFDAALKATWREPQGADQPRTPDAWTFSLAGPASVTLTLGDGMAGVLHGAGTADGAGTVDGAVIADSRVVGATPLALAAGDYRLDVTSLGRNDRLDYTIALSSDALQPDVPRTVTLPARVAFAIATARVVSLTSFGTVPVKAVLRAADGTVIDRAGARADDWNIAVSRLLPAGSYTLDLAAATPPAATGTASPAGDDADDDAASAGGQLAQTGATRTAATPTAQAADASSQSDDADAADDTKAPGDGKDPESSVSGDSATSGDSGGSDDDKPAPGVELRLALPAALPAIPAPAATAMLAGIGVHVLTLERPEPGSLVVAAARASAALVLALERQEADGWRTEALDTGTAPVVAAPADAGAAPWRVEVWAVDGGPDPIQLAARAVTLAAQPAGAVTLGALDGVPTPLAAARVKLAVDGIATLDGAPKDLLAGGWPGHGLVAANRTVLPAGAEIWLLGRAPGPIGVAPEAIEPGQRLALTVPGKLVTHLPALPGPVALWRAESGLGQPSLGAAMGVATGSALALADAPVPLRNATGDGALRLSLTRLAPALAAPRTLDGPLQTMLPPNTAQPVVLPAGDKRIELALPPDTAAIAGWKGRDAVIAWAGDDAVARTLAGAWTDLLLVNAGSAPAPVSLGFAPAPAEALRPGTAFRRFFGAAGSFELPVTGGTRLVAAGNAGLSFIDADGSVARGRDIALGGPGRVVVTHGAGAVAVWVEAPGASPWPEVQAQTVTLPARVTLAGAAMALRLAADTPVLLDVTTTAPVLAALAQPGSSDPPALFADGAELHRVVEGGAELRLYSPTDGPLTGTLEVSATPILPIGEGLGAAVSVAPGRSVAFGFTVAQAGMVGVGVRATPDTATVRVLDATGAVLGRGVAQLLNLPAGRYVIEAAVPPNSAAATLRPAVVGITPRGSGPPPEIARQYLELAGMKPTEPVR